MDSQQFGNYSLVDFASGIVHGLQRYENQTSKCSTDVLQLQSVLNELVAIWNTIVGGSFDITRVMLFLYSTWSTLTIIEGSCHFYALLKDLATLLNPVAFVLRIFHIVFVGTWTIVPATFRFFWFIINGDSFNAGINVGRIIGAIFEYQIE